MAENPNDFKRLHMGINGANLAVYNNSDASIEDAYLGIALLEPNKDELY